MMRRIALMLVMLCALFVLTVMQQFLTERKTLALYDHPSQAEQMVYPHERTFFEASVRSTRSYVVPIDVDTRQTDLASEGKIVTEHDARRWHRSQTWRRMS